MKKELQLSDGVFQGPYTEASCQDYMDIYGAYEGKKPFLKDEEYLNYMIGKDDFKDLRKRVKDSCKEIRKAFKDMTPKHFGDDLPDDED